MKIAKIVRMAAVTFLTAGLAGAVSADEVSDVAKALAERARAAQQVMERLSSPETAQVLVESVLDGDAARFEGLFDGIDLEIPNRCYWIASTVQALEKKGEVPVEECRLRDDLTPWEWRLFLRILLKHGTSAFIRPDGVIEPGAFLDELKAYNLVRCPRVETSISGLTLAIAAPERFCLLPKP